MPIYKDTERNTWYCSFYYKDWQGNRRLKKKRGFKTAREAKEFERSFFDKTQENSEMNFKSLYELYIADATKRLKASTVDTKRNIIEKKILPYFQNLQLCEIGPTTIRHWQNEMLSKGYSQTYLRTVNNQLSAMLNFAVKYYGLNQNPCHVTGSIGKKKAGEMEIWTLDEFNKFISVVDKPAMKLAFEIMFWTGARVGETIALTPADILPDKYIDINKTLYKVDGEYRNYDPKTTKSARKIPIPDFLYEHITDYIKRIYGIAENDRIFYFTKGTLNKNLDYYAALAGVKRIRVHDLRHSHASLLIDMDQPILLISERLGHENVNTTWNTYAHLYPDKGKKLVEALETVGMSETKKIEF